MERRRGTKTRPITSEEVECWAQAAESLTTLSHKYSSPSTLETIERVNRLIRSWPPDDTLPAEGFDYVRSTYKKLYPGLHDIQTAAEEEAKLVDAALEKIGVLIALRTASPEEKRYKRPRGPSPSGTPVPTSGITTNGRTGVSITLPARNSVGPSPAIPLARDHKSRRETLTKQLPLRPLRKVAFHPPKAADGGAKDADDTWILALITKCISAEKNKYEVQDAEPGEDGLTGQLYQTTLRSIIPLPDSEASPGAPEHVSSYQEFPVGSTVLALYPDTSCFYRAEVLATPKDMHPSGRNIPSSKHVPVYRLRFDDDDNQEHPVLAQWVVEWPNA